MPNHVGSATFKPLPEGLTQSQRKHNHSAQKNVFVEGCGRCDFLAAQIAKKATKEKA